MIVPVAGAPATAAFDDAFESVSENVSSASSSASPAVATVTVFVVSPAANVSVPEAAVKSSPSAAVSPDSRDAAQFTVTDADAAGDSVTANDTAAPSTADASDALSDGISLIVPAAVNVVPPPANVAFIAFDSVSVNVSLSSSSVSEAAVTGTVALVCPASIVTVCDDSAVKSAASAVSDESIDVDASTVTSLPLAVDSSTAKFTVPPSAPVASATLSTGGSSLSLIVPVAVDRASMDSAGTEPLALNVSASSSRVSSTVATAAVFCVSPGSKVNWTTADAKSAADAVSPTAMKGSNCTITVFPLASESVATNSTSAPSVAVASAMARVGGSSLSTIVPVAVGSAASAAVDGSDNVTVKVSSNSSVVSSAVGTGMVAVVDPFATVTVSVVVPRSASTALSVIPIDAVQVAVRSAAMASDRVAVKLT